MEDLGLEDIEKKRSSFEVTPDEEVWIVQCPKSIDLHDLVGSKIKFGGVSKTSLKVDEISIDCNTQEYPENQTINVAMGNGKLRQLESVGAIKIKKKSVSSINDQELIQTDLIKREASSKKEIPDILSPKRKKTNTSI